MASQPPQTRTVNGMTYARGADGRWYSQGQQNPVARPADPRLPAQTRREVADATRAEAVAGVSPVREAAEAERAVAEARTAADRATRTPGQEALDSEYAKRFADWRLRDSHDVRRNIDQLRGAQETLGSYDVTGRVLGRLPDFMLDDRVVNTRELVEEVVQRNLRTILGAQFTEKEGERLIARAYNPRLDESVNRERLGRLIRQMESAAQANDEAARYFEEHGSLEGWQGRLWSTGNFNPERDTVPERPAVSNDGQQPRAADGSRSGDYRIGPDGNLEIDIVGGTREPPPPGPTTGGYDDSYLSQGLSGVNSGIASTLGFPVDALTGALNLVPAGIDAIANTNLGRIEDPTLGGEWWRRQLGNAGAIGRESADPSRQFVRRVGESVGAAAVPAAGTAGTLGRAGLALIPAAGGGAGAAVAQQVAPDNPLAELAGEIAGSGGTVAGMFAAGRRSARRRAEAAVPTISELRSQAGDLYRQAESRGVVAGPNLTTNLAGRARQIAQDEVAITPQGRPLPGYDTVNSSMTLLDDFAGQNMSATEIDRVRRAIAGNVRRAPEANERRINNMVLRAFDEETLPLAPEFGRARGLASRYLNAEEIGEARSLADAAASNFSQSGIENALRNQFRNLDRRMIRGQEQFPPALSDAIRNVSRGTPASNAARQVGKLAPTSVVPTTLGGGAGFMIGNALGGPIAGGIGAGTVAGAGMFGRSLATRMTQRHADVADLIARAGGPIPNDPAISPGLRRAIAAGLAGQIWNTGN